MGPESKAHSSESRLAAYVEAIASVLGHADRVVPFQSYCAGLLLPGDRKSVEPMAARVQPARVRGAGPAALPRFASPPPCRVPASPHALPSIIPAGACAGTTIHAPLLAPGTSAPAAGQGCGRRSRAGARAGQGDGTAARGGQQQARPDDPSQVEQSPLAADAA